MTARKTKTTQKQAPAKQAPAKKSSAAKKSAPKKPSVVKKAGASKAQEVSVAAVNLGHIFALRPRVNTAFPQAEFLKAKRELADERYASIPDAARALAEKALENVQRKPGKHSIGSA